MFHWNRAAATNTVANENFSIYMKVKSCRWNTGVGGEGQTLLTC